MRSPLLLFLVALAIAEPRLLQAVRDPRRLAAATPPTIRRKPVVNNIKGPSAVSFIAAGDEGGFVYSCTVGDKHRARRSLWLVAVQTFRGGGQGGGGGGGGGRSATEHRRERRPLGRFIAPALVWVVAASVDYALWWKLGPAAAAEAATAAAEIAASRDRAIGGAACGVAAAITANRWHFVCFRFLLFVALLSHIAVTVSDPGFIPSENAPAHGQERDGSKRWCDRCNAAKPLRTHHCRRCGACVARMDHHCIYAANCVGAGNHKQFLLLLLYSGACAAHASFLFLFHFGRNLDPTAAMKSNSPPFFSFSSSSGGDFGEDTIVSNAFLASKVAAAPFSFARRGGYSYWWVVAGGVSSLAIFTWLLIVLAVQLYGTVVDAGSIDRMQQAAMVPSSAESKATVAVVGGVADGVGNKSPPPCSCACNHSPPPGAATGAFTSVVDIPRGPAAVAAAALGSSAGVDSDVEGGDSWRISRLAACCVKSWRTLREETLGDGPWLMWFVPSRAKLSPEIEGRLYYDER